ncbi:unnamed protein product [Cochlearia groenlandica]
MEMVLRNVIDVNNNNNSKHKQKKIVNPNSNSNLGWSRGCYRRLIHRRGLSYLREVGFDGSAVTDVFLPQTAKGEKGRPGLKDRRQSRRNQSAALYSVNKLPAAAARSDSRSGSVSGSLFQSQGGILRAVVVVPLEPSWISTRDDGEDGL